jgi:transcription antitermination factor NusG
MSSTQVRNFEAIRWFVCHTKPRCEKKFSHLLKIERITHYLPLVSTLRRYATRERRIEKPLFPGYVFAELEPERKNRVYQLDLLVRTIWVEEQALFLRQLDDVRRIVESGLQATLVPLLKKGTPVRITAGPLRGVEGLVEDPSAPKGVLISMDVLQQGILVPVPVEHIMVLS